MKDPADNPVVWTEIVKSLLASILCLGPGEIIMDEIILDVDGIFPITRIFVR